MRTLLEYTGLVAALALSACSAQPDDIFFIQGQILDEGGAPVPQAALTISRTAEPRPDGVTCGRMAPFARSVTRADGLWSQSLIRQETLAPDGQPACFQVLYSYAAGSGRGFVEAGFTFPPTDVRLPPLRAWNWDLGAEPAESGARISFRPVEAPAPDAPLRMYPVEHWVQVRAAAGTVWQARLDGNTWVAGPDVLEDFGPARFSIVAEHDVVRGGVAGFFPDAVYTLRESSPETELPSSPTTPVSRGAACGVGSASLAPCPLTDGALVTWILPPSTRELVVRLPAAATLRRAVLREPTFAAWYQRLSIEGATDASGPWAPLGEMSPPPPLVSRADPTIAPPLYLSGPLDPAAGPVVWVRVRALDGGDNPIPIWSVKEVSLFE